MPTQKRGSLDLDEDMSTSPQGKNYLLSIAVNAYEHAPRLSNCVGDAQAIVDVLLSKYDFHKENVITLYDKAATRANIDQNLRKLARKIKEEDNLVIYFAGHGVFDKDGQTGGYLVPVEAKPGNYWEFLSNGNFLTLIKAIKSFHTFLLMDSCFSGSLFRTMEDSGTKLAENVERFPSRWGLAAGMVEEVEDGWHGENSPFAQAVLNYLETNTDAKFPVSSLIQYTREVVPNNAKQTPTFGRLYKTGDLGGEFVFHLKKDEVADWKVATTADTVMAYQVYLSTYPDGKYIASATVAIKKMEASALWQKIENTPDDNTYQINQKTRLIDEFIKNYSSEPHYRQVLQEGEKMGWKVKFLKAGTGKYALLNFISENPPFFKEEAQGILKAGEVGRVEEQKESERIRKEQLKKQEVTQKKVEAERLKKEAEGKEQKAKALFLQQQQQTQKIKVDKAKQAQQNNTKNIPTYENKQVKPSFFQEHGKKIGLVVLLLVAGLVVKNFFFKGLTTIEKVMIEYKNLLKGGTDDYNNDKCEDAIVKFDDAIKLAKKHNIDFADAEVKKSRCPTDNGESGTVNEGGSSQEISEMSSLKFSVVSKKDEAIIAIKGGVAPYKLKLEKRGIEKLQKTYKAAGEYKISIKDYRRDAGTYTLVLVDAKGNKKAESLVIKKETTTVTPSTKPARIEFVQETYNFGTVTEGEKVTQTYKFKNTGGQPLKLSQVKSSCGCVAPTWPKEPIAPGKTGEVKLVFNTKGKTGKRNQKTTITANTEPSYISIYLTGEVKKESLVNDKVSASGIKVEGGLGGRGIVKYFPLDKQNGIAGLLENQLSKSIILNVCVDNNGNVLRAKLSRKSAVKLGERVRGNVISTVEKWKFSKSDIEKQCGTITY